MKKILFYLLPLLMLAGCGSRSTRNYGGSVSIESANLFFDYADRLAAGEQITDQEWQTLLNSPGYRIIADHFGEELIAAPIKIAFDPDKRAELYRWLAIQITEEFYEGPNAEVMPRVAIDNFTKMSDNWNELKKFSREFKPEAMKCKAIDHLKTFLVSPVDSLIEFPVVAYLCYDWNARMLDGGITLDLNFIYQLGEEGHIKLLAHEMFHAYLNKVSNKKLYDASPVIRALSLLENEGIADQVDKKSIEQLFVPGYDEINEYILRIYNQTPLMLHEFDDITAAWLHDEMSDVDYADTSWNFFPFEGHANGFYMTSVIKQQGLMPELMADLGNTVHFVRVYNKAAAGANEYVFSEEFMHYLEKLEKTCSGDI